jgi:Arc/MetJ-type ribon-helix-helix transcriptional regulator
VFWRREMVDNESSIGRTSLRLDDADRKAIDQLVADGEYVNLSEFVRQAVKEKLNPKLRRARQRKELMELLKDPTIRAEIRQLEIDNP